MYFQPFSSGRVEYVKSGYGPLERVPGERATPSSTRAYIGLAFGHISHVRRGDNESGAGVPLSTIYLLRPEKLLMGVALHLGVVGRVRPAGAG